MPPVFVVPELARVPEGGSCSLPPAEAVHAARVLRLSPGDAVGLIDGRGLRAPSVVLAASPAGVEVRVGVHERPAPPRPTLRIAAAAPKGARAEAMVDQLAQLGVAAWTPLLTARGNPDGSANRRRRWERAAAEAAKQCGRADFLAVEPAASLADLLAARSPDAAGLLVLADPGGERPAVSDSVEAVDFLVGPEGGFTDGETAAARSAGAVAWRLAPHVLRIEAAAAAAAAAVRALAR